MAFHAFSSNFDAFFYRLNPSSSFVEKAAREHKAVTELIENVNGPARILAPRCFLQGSYRQRTAMYTINDVDIVVLCELWQPGSGESSGRSWGRDEIFTTIAAPLWADGRYREKVRFGPTSMCIKVDLGIKLEILPVVYKAGCNDPQAEPFRLFRPENGQWEDGYARNHQALLTWKNSNTDGNFIPAIKVFKHLRSFYKLDAVSFHIECLLFSLPDNLFAGGPADWIRQILAHLARTSALDWYSTRIPTPCGERDIFTSNEWAFESWCRFHEIILLASRLAALAQAAEDRKFALESWQALLGEDYFPQEVAR
jgi:hypothetical protein